MKLYRIYKLPPKKVLETLTDDVIFEDICELYAYTNDKDLKDEFMSMRNKEIFIEKSSKCTREEYAEFGNVHSFNLLEYRKYTLYEYNDTKYATEKEIEVLSTRYEEDVVLSFIECDGNIPLKQINYDFFPYVLNNKYLEVLSTLEFQTFWKMFIHRDRLEYYTLFMNQEEFNDALSYDYPNVQHSTFQYFLYLFQDTFK